MSGIRTASIAEVIRARRAQILDCWSREAARTDHAGRLAEPDVAELFPKLLDSLAASNSRWPAGGGTRDLVRRHVRTRLKRGFDPAALIEGFALLGRCVRAEWDHASPEGRPGAGDVDGLHAELHAASAEVAHASNDLLEIGGRFEGRYLRLLQEIATQGLREGALPLSDRLREVLSIVMKAVGARGAALALLDAKSGRLVAASSAGVGAGELERYAASLAPSSFDGKSQTERGAAVRLLPMSEPLQRAGIQSLVGVRLPPRQLSVGVLYLGLAEARTLTDQELRRAESLGERLTLHLETARLYADLKVKVEALKKERQSREQFVFLLAHDLRGPLTAATSFAQLLGRTAPTERDRRIASRIDANLERVDQMIRDLLDANRLQAGEPLPLKKAACDLVQVAREVVDEVSQTYKGQLKLEAEAGVTGIWDEVELRRALWNLVSNAVKYGERGRPITVSARREGPWAVAAVHNHGPAIPPSERKVLFQPFGRSHPADEGGKRSWGLGLTLVRACAEAHGGSVEVDSAEGRGTTFSLRIPIQAADEPVVPMGWSRHADDHPQ